MDEITDHLAAIDENVEDVLRAQKDAVLADVIGDKLVVDEAIIIREQIGQVTGRRPRSPRRRRHKYKDTRGGSRDV